MQSIDDKILESVRKCGRGTVFTPSRFSQYGTAFAVQKAFDRLTDEGRIIRVARGIYCYPKTDTDLGLGVIYPHHIRDACVSGWSPRRLLGCMTKIKRS